MYCSWLTVRPAPPGRGGYVRGFSLEQAHADQPPVVIDALDRVAVQLELGDDGGWEVNPAGMQRPAGRRPRAVAPAAVVPGRQRASSTHWSTPADCGRPERFQATLLPPDVWRLAVWPPPTAAPTAVDSRAVRSWPPTWRRCPLRRRELEHESNAWLATSSNSTRSTSVREPPGPEHPGSARSTQGAPQPVEQPYPAQRLLTDDLELPRRARPRHPAAVNLGEPGDRRRQSAQSVAGSRRPSCAGTAQRARRSRSCAPRADPSSR